MRNYFQSYSAASDVSETASATICAFHMGRWKEFDITVTCTALEGMQFNVYGSPVEGSAIQVLVTGATAVTDFCAGARTVVVSTIRNNNLNHFWIEAAATAGGREVSSSELSIIVTAIEE